MLRFILCDDNPEHCRTLELHVRQALSRLSRPYEIALVTTQADEALRYAQEHPEQNVYMLDLVLEQKMDGLALCRVPSQKECLPMTGFRRRTDALVHTVLVNAGLVPIPLFINAPDPQGAFAATLPLVEYIEFIIQGGRGNCNPRL